MISPNKEQSTGSSLSTIRQRSGSEQAGPARVPVPQARGKLLGWTSVASGAASHYGLPHCLPLLGFVGFRGLYSCE